MKHLIKQRLASDEMLLTCLLLYGIILAVVVINTTPPVPEVGTPHSTSVYYCLCKDQCKPEQEPHR